MRILFCGDRSWTNYKVICDVMIEHQPTVVIEGGANGADSLALEAAEAFDVRVQSFPAEWDKYGKAAGPIRNTRMLNEGKPDLVIAFHDDLQNSRGTLDMVNQTQKRKIPLKVYNSKGTLYCETRYTLL